jgi:ferredoxin-NADP reductase
LLFISAGSGITPIMSMLRSLSHQDEMNDVVLLHSARNEDEIIFGDQLRDLEEKHDGFKLHKQLTKEMGRLEPKDLDELCEDWKERETFISGPAELLDAIEDHYSEHHNCDCLHMERFQPVLGKAEEGEGGKIKFLESDEEAESDGSQPILVAGEDKGLDLPYGCREGICHTCVGELCSGKIRNLQNGKVSGSEGEMIRTCINAPEGDVEIKL